MGGLWWSIAISLVIIPPSYFFIRDAVKDTKE
jgi:Cu/Ag efflux pump CusA